MGKMNNSFRGVSCNVWLRYHACISYIASYNIFLRIVVLTLDSTVIAGAVCSIFSAAFCMMNKKIADVIYIFNLLYNVM